MKRNSRGRRASKTGFWQLIKYASLSTIFVFGLASIIATGGGGGDEGSDLVTEFDVPIVDITVDGNRDDWTAITPAATDVEGDDISSFTGADLKELYIAQSSDGKTIYVMMSFWDGPPNSTLASSYTTDGNEEWPNRAMGYSVFFDHNLDGIYEGALGARFDPSSSEWFPVGEIVDAEIGAGDVLELSFLSSEIGSPAQTYFKANVDNSAFMERRENIPEFGHWVLIYFGTGSSDGDVCCPHPENGEDSVSVYTFLSWGHSDTPLGSLTYDVYLGTSANPPLVKSNHETLFYFPDPLNDNTTYYWKIVARNEQGLATEGPLWRFYTFAEPSNNPPDVPSDPYPEHGAVSIVPPVDLSWNCSDQDGDDIKYHLYWGLTEALTNYTHDIDTTTYTLLSLFCSHRHYWKIIAEDEHGAAVEGPLWYFDAATCSSPNWPPCEPCEPCEPCNPSPPDGATGIDPKELLLNWECCDPDGVPYEDTLAYSVSWWTTPEETNVSPALPYSSWTLFNLKPNTQYYWQVFAKDLHNPGTFGPVWTFWTSENGFEVPLFNNHYVAFGGTADNDNYGVTREESWINYLNHDGQEWWSGNGGYVGQHAYVVIDGAVKNGITNYGHYTYGYYDLASTSKGHFSTASLKLWTGVQLVEPCTFLPFYIQFYIDDVLAGQLLYQLPTDPELGMDIEIPLDFDAVKTGSDIRVEVRSDKFKQENPVPIERPGESHNFLEWIVFGDAMILLE